MRSPLCCVLPAPPELLYPTGLQTHPWVGIHSFVRGPSGACKTACNVIMERFPWVVFSRNVSCLFSRRGEVTKTTPNKKGKFCESRGSVYHVNFRESYLGGGRK